MDAFLLRLLYLDLRFIYDGANPCHLFGRYPGDLAPELGSAVRYGNSTHKSFSRSCETIRVRIATKRSVFLAIFERGRFMEIVDQLRIPAATKDRFIRTRIVSQLLEKLLCVELPY